MINYDEAVTLLEKWSELLRINNNWDTKIELVLDTNFNKTGDIKIDVTDKKAIIFLNKKNPRNENIEEVILHELLHLKLYPLDQLTETLIINHYEPDSKSYNTIYEQFMIALETTVEELTKCFLLNSGENKHLSFGRVETMKSFNELYEGLNNLN